MTHRIWANQALQELCCLHSRRWGVGQTDLRVKLLNPVWNLQFFSNYSLLVKSMRTMNPTTDLTRDGDSFNSLGNLSQLLGVIIFTIRFFPLLLNLNLFPATCYLLCPQWKCRAVCYFSICNNLFYTFHKCDHISSCRFS